jgi:signal transduction histidine kinase
MRHSWEDRPGLARERPARRTRRNSRRREEEPDDLTPEQQAYREAERRVQAKLRLVRHAIIFGAVLLLLTRVNTWALFIALPWGIFLASHFFRAIIAPRLRERWIREEVGRQVQASVHRERRVLQGEQSRSLEELSASIAHEIRNPITAAKSLVQQMGEDPAAPENVEYARVALEELGRVERSISHLLRYAREEDLELEPTALAEICAAALTSLRDRIHRQAVEVETRFDARGALRGDPEKLRRVFINLITNALEAFAGAGTRDPRIRIDVGENLAGSQVWARVRDNGPGMDSELQARVFKPFCTSKPDGTGLGLAICRKLVESHGGTLELGASPGSGAEFTLTFPRDRGARA